MGNVLYLFGAGASAGAIPVVNKMSNEITTDIKEFNLIVNQAVATGYDFMSKRKLVEDILADLKTACENYYSIDTYAKKLYLTDSQEFIKLKYDLSFYFTLRQIIRQPDKRYDNFWASVLEVQDSLPNNIRILSWNYDFQLELTYLNMSSKVSLKSSKDALNVHLPTESKSVNDGFSVMKLNGSATNFNLESNEINYLCEASPKHTKEMKIKQLLDNYELLISKSTNKSELKFAWEADLDTLNIKKFVEGYRVLAVIGYSFPYFNRKIDRLIIDSLIKEGRLEHLYIQDSNPEVILERMEQIRSGFYAKRTLVRDLEQFVFPIEL
jgi:hypothetical protein